MNGQTPHLEPRADGKLSCEMLWLANSSKGDYHDNMNSDNFMFWVQNKLVPMFDKFYPNKKMILMAKQCPIPSQAGYRISGFKNQGPNVEDDG